MNRFTLIIILLSASSLGMAQSNQTLYHMRSLPQVMHSNPANTPDSRMFVGIPALSSLYIEFNMAGINPYAINQAIVPNQDSDSFTFDITKLSGVFDKNSYIQLGFNHDYLHFGFLANKTLITFSATEKVKIRVDLPGDLFKLAFEGNGGDNLGKAYALNAALDLRHTREFALGFQRSFFDDALRVGGRIKYIYGLNVIQTKQNDLFFKTRENDFALTMGSNIEINAASSFVSIDQEGEVDPQKILYGAKNDGWGLDLGLSLDVNERLTLSASIIDLGFINWNENAFNLKSRNPYAQFEFKGLDAAQFFSDSLSLSKSFEQMGDSLIDLFALDSSRNKFTTGLLTEIYIGASLNLSKRHSLGLLLYGNYYNKSLYPAVTFSWNARLSPKLATSLSYTAMKKNYGNLGFGFSLNLGALQYYIVSDNTLGFFTGDFKNIGFRTGLNLTLKRTIKDDLGLNQRIPKEQIDPPTDIY